MYRFRHNDLIGVDIGSSAVKMVQLRKGNGGWTVVAAGLADVVRTTGGLERQEESKIIRAVKDCLRSARVKTRMAVCGVSGPDVAVRPFKFPALSQDEMEGAIRLEASQLCPFNIDDCSVSYQVISNGDNSVSGIFVAVVNKLVERKKRCAESASLDTVLMDVDGLALLNCFGGIEKPDADRTIAILNVGSSCATLAIMGNDSVPFVRDIACPGDGIAEVFGGEHGYSAEVGRQTLSVGASDDRPQRKPGEISQKSSAKLAVDVNETLRYYVTRDRSTFVEKLFVCGGPALLDGFVGWLGEELDVETVLWNPFEKTVCEGNEDCHELLAGKGPAMAVAAGLAMRSI
jgi:type IV pilus assembly protein PilM